MGLREVVDRVCARYRIGALETVSQHRSQLDPFEKFVFATEDGHALEAVKIPLEKPGRIVVCASSQIGCGLACDFCATGKMGLHRNLQAWEIVEQVRAISATIERPNRVSGVVFQGMGEPLANLDAVIKAIAVLCHPAAGAIDQRMITVSTAGLPHGILALANSAFRVRLGISIGSANPDVRARLMPISAKFPLEQVLQATAKYSQKRGDSPMFSYTLLDGVNDSPDDADAFGRLAVQFRAATGLAPRMSLIPWNAIDGSSYRRCPEERAHAFFVRLSSFGIPVVRRYSGGSDIGAACGQLATQARHRLAQVP
jgi:23S rRNA (adenine2503-C2)-methyltransferase